MSFDYAPAPKLDLPSTGGGRVSRARKWLLIASVPFILVLATQSRPVSADTQQGTGTGGQCVTEWTLYGTSTAGLSRLSIGFRLQMQGSPTVVRGGWYANGSPWQWTSWTNANGGSSDFYVLPNSSQGLTVFPVAGSTVNASFKVQVLGYASNSCVIISDVLVSRTFYAVGGVTPPPNGGGFSPNPSPTTGPTQPAAPTPQASHGADSWCVPDIYNLGNVICYPPPPTGWCYTDTFLVSGSGTAFEECSVTPTWAPPTAGPTATPPVTDCASSTIANPVDVYYTKTVGVDNRPGQCIVRLHEQAGNDYKARFQLFNLFRDQNYQCILRWADNPTSDSWSGGGTQTGSWGWGSCPTGDDFDNAQAWTNITDGMLIGFYSAHDYAGYWEVDIKVDVVNNGDGQPVTSGNGEPTPTPAASATAVPTAPPVTVPPGWSLPPILVTFGPIDICPKPRPTPEIAACVEVSPNPTLSATADPSSAAGAIADLMSDLNGKAPFGYVSQVGDALTGALADPIAAEDDMCVDFVLMSQTAEFCFPDYSEAAEFWRPFFAVMLTLTFALSLLWLVYSSQGVSGDNP